MYSRSGERGGIEQILHWFQIVDEVIFCPLLDEAYVIVPDYAMAAAERLASNASAQSGWAVKIIDSGPVGDWHRAGADCIAAA